MSLRIKQKQVHVQFLPSKETCSVQFNCSVVSDSLRPHEPQHARPPCPSPTPGVHPNSHPLSRDRVTQWQNSQGSNSSPGRITATQAHCHTDKAQGQAKKCPHGTSLVVQWLGLHLPGQAVQICSLVGGVRVPRASQPGNQGMEWRQCCSKFSEALWTQWGKESGTDRERSAAIYTPARGAQPARGDLPYGAGNSNQCSVTA